MNLISEGEYVDNSLLQRVVVSEYVDNSLLQLWQFRQKRAPGMLQVGMGVIVELEE